MADRKIADMHRKYGKNTAHRCADCPNLCIYATSSYTRHKCNAYGDSCSSATDWAKKWAACGLYGKTLDRYWWRVLCGDDGFMRVVHV